MLARHRRKTRSGNCPKDVLVESPLQARSTGCFSHGVQPYKSLLSPQSYRTGVSCSSFQSRQLPECLDVAGTTTDLLRYRDSGWRYPADDEAPRQASFEKNDGTRCRSCGSCSMWPVCERRVSSLLGKLPWQIGVYEAGKAVQSAPT